ncbi:MAG: glycosyltransferase family 39 protein [Bacteroidales bacterium]|nr:glycosyltransferase family 39 protein [Bacteroidales bacterium]
MRIDKNDLYTQVIIAIIAALLFIPFIGRLHLFDWDEINFAESAREMIVTKDYLTVQINYLPFWEKPPLFIWMQVLSMKIFGINEFAARFPNAICGIVTLLILYNIGKKLYNRNFGLLWILIYTGSFLPFLYFKSGIIDPWFNLFIFLSIFFAFNYIEKNERRKLNIILSALFIGLAVLTKGPVAFLIFGLTAFIYFIIKRFRINTSVLDIFIFFLVFIISGGFWFFLQIFNGNYQIIQDFIEYQIRLLSTKDAGHSGFLFYHFIVLLIGVFPASIFAIKGFLKGSNDNIIQKNFKLLMIILFWVVLLLFTIVKTKIVHYSSMCYFPLTYLAVYAIYNIIYRERKINTWIIFSVRIIGILYALAAIFLAFFERFKINIIENNWVTDRFTIGNIMTEVNWKGFEWIIGIFWLIILISAIIIRIKGLYKFLISLLFSGIIIYTSFILLFYTPRIEKYTQNAAIEFYKSLQDKDCYVETLDMKSYAKYFYTRKKKPLNLNSYDKKWLLTGDIDKDVYFVVRNKKEAFYKLNYPDLDKLYERGGYVFFHRKK